MKFSNSDLIVNKTRRIKHEKYVGMLPAKIWFSDTTLAPGFLLQDSDVVVCTFTAYETGGPEFSLDSRSTVAICRRAKDAKLIYKNYKETK